MMRALDTLLARTILASLTGLTLMHMVSLWSYEAALDEEMHQAQEMRLAEKLAALKLAVEAVPEEAREDMAQRLSGSSSGAHWSKDAQNPPAAHASPDLAARLSRLAPGLKDGDILIEHPHAEARPHSPHSMQVTLRLADGSLLHVRADSSGARQHSAREMLHSTVLMAFGAVLVSVLIARWLTRPIRILAGAVHALRPGSEGAQVPETGPAEVRDLAAAFNGMQRRISRLISERTTALAAVSHDLRTPLTRLRLKAGDLDARDAGASIAADIAELEQMIDATLSYLRGDDQGENARLIDLAALLKTLTGDAADMGLDVTFSGPHSVAILGRRLGLKRAFANLIQNAVKYGGSARISARQQAGCIQVHVDDAGPGIPEDQLGSVVEPFVRLETSRNRETGGTGLGLTIAKANIEADGGTLVLTNRPGGGLRAAVTFPLPATDGGAAGKRNAG